MQNGKDGVSADSKYTWVKYSQNADGSDLTDDPTDAIYIGIAYNMETQEESNDPSDYSWTRIKGDDGESGTDAYTIILGNENISFSVEYDSNKALSDQSYSSTVQIIQGVTERTDFTIGVVSSANGITITKNDQDKTLVLSVQEGDVITADSGYFRIPINIDGLVFYKDLTWTLARQGKPGEQGQAGDGAINVVVANESQTIACTNDGLVAEGVLINIPFIAFKGLEKVPCSAVVGILPSGITLGSNTPSTADEDGLIVLNVAAKADLGGSNILSGYISITFNVESQNILKRFIWTKTKNGKDGNTYSLELSSVIVNKNYDGTLSPQSITLKAFYQDGTERVPYEGRFIIAESYFNDVYLTDESNNLLIDENNNLLFLSGSSGSVYENVYVSSENESEYTHALSDTVSGLICYLCAADSVTNILDQQSVTVLTYIDDIKPIITEITTTMSGVSQKIDAVEKSITDKVWQKDITDAINNYDGTTVKTIRDQVSQINISIDGITSEVSDVKSTLITKADGSVVQELSEKVSKVEQDADGFRQTVEDNYVTNDDLDENNQTLRSEFTQTANEISQSVTDLEGNVSSITQDLSSIKQRVEDAEGNITSLEETASGLTTRVENNEGDISTLQQTVSGFDQTVSNIEGDISEITQNVESITQRVSNAEGDISNIQQTADNLQTQISNNAGDISQLQQDAEGIKTTVSNIKIGARNLQLGSALWADNAFYSKGNAVISNGELTVPIGASTDESNVETHYISVVLNDVFTISIDIKGESEYTGNTILIELFNSLEERIDYQWLETDVTTSWSRISTTITIESSDAVYMRIGLRSSNNVVNTYRLLKIEKGNKATDWTPAPEDQATADDIEVVQESITGIDERVTASASEIEQLANSISTLVTDENGQTLMEQTSEGWTFNIGAIQSQIDEATAGLDTVEKNLNSTTDMVNKANDLLDDVTQKTAYINMATDDSGAPCIELGKQGNPFKLRITNTSIDFMQDNMRIAYITNRQLYIEKSVFTDEMKVGSTSVFIWKKRANGNMGLRWVGE